MVNRKGKPKGSKNINERDKVCFHCSTTSSPNFGRIDGKIYCNKHLLHLRRYGKIKDHTLKDANTFRIDIENRCVFIDIRNIEGIIIDKCIIDLDDWDKIKEYKWSLTMKHSPYIFNRKRGRTPIHIYIHRLILGLEYGDEKIGDHINGDTLDNRKENLRIVNYSQNGMNSAIHKDNSSGYKGVYFSKISNKWAAQIVLNGKTISLGTFDSIEDAIEARKTKEIDLFGEYSRQYGENNF